MVVSVFCVFLSLWCHECDCDVTTAIVFHCDVTTTIVSHGDVTIAIDFHCDVTSTIVFHCDVTTTIVFHCDVTIAIDFHCDVTSTIVFHCDVTNVMWKCDFSWIRKVEFQLRLFDDCDVTSELWCDNGVTDVTDNP